MSRAVVLPFAACGGYRKRAGFDFKRTVIFSERVVIGYGRTVPVYFIGKRVVLCAVRNVGYGDSGGCNNALTVGKTARGYFIFVV